MVLTKVLVLIMRIFHCKYQRQSVHISVSLFNWHAKLT